VEARRDRYFQGSASLGDVGYIADDVDAIADTYWRSPGIKIVFKATFLMGKNELIIVERQQPNAALAGVGRRLLIPK
jgi:hypothetical protein